MKSARVKSSSPLSGSLSVPGDKSITHRGVILGSLAEGVTMLSGYLPSEDCLRTVAAFQAMGIRIEPTEDTLRISGKGLSGLSEPSGVLDLGNSGTSIRLLAGVLAPQPFFSVVTGDTSLRSRPMGRVVEPLRKMGGKVVGRAGGDRAPLAFLGGPLTGIRYDLPVASAQVKSALLLAGLFAKGETVLSEPSPSRDHTERIFQYLGLPLQREEGLLRLSQVKGFSAREMRVPGDFSSAAFWVVAATLVADSDIRIRGVGMNPTRTGLLDVLQEMGGQVDVENFREDSGEPVADLRVRAAGLKGTRVGGRVIPRLIDEFPILCVAAALAEGETVIRDAKELRFKESDRIAAMVETLSAMGVRIEAFPDGVCIQGGALQGGSCNSRGDHRVAMAMIVAGLVAKGETIVEDTDCITTSYPRFVEKVSDFAGTGVVQIHTN